MKTTKTQMSESEIRRALAESSQHTVTGMMRYMKNLYNGRYDNKVARKNAKEMCADIPKY